MKIKIPIRGTFDIDYPFYISIYRMAESGEIIINGDKIKMRIGPLYYEISNIESLEIVNLDKLNFETCIKMNYTNKGVLKTVYIYDYKYFGLNNFFNSGNQKLMNKLKKFKNSFS